MTKYGINDIISRSVSIAEQTVSRMSYLRGGIKGGLPLPRRGDADIARTASSPTLENYEKWGTYAQYLNY